MNGASYCGNSASRNFNRENHKYRTLGGDKNTVTELTLPSFGVISTAKADARLGCNELFKSFGCLRLMVTRDCWCEPSRDQLPCPLVASPRTEGGAGYEDRLEACYKIYRVIAITDKTFRRV